MVKAKKTANNVLDWLLEPENPGVRYLALRDLVKADVRELDAAKKAAHKEGPIAAILSKMDKEGFWARPGAGYAPSYTGTIWSVILLAQLGATIDMDKRIATACNYLLDHSCTKYGQFTVNGKPSGTLDCLQGGLCGALLEMDCKDARLDKAYEYMARSVTGEGIAPATDRKAPLRYYAAKTGPVFACSATYKKPCAWGAVDVMLAFGKLPAGKRTRLINEAIQTGIDFLFSKDPAVADYPVGISREPTGKPSGNWWKFGFPVFYTADVLKNVEALALLGCGKNPLLVNAIRIILDKQENGRWLMERNYAGKTWVDFGPKKQPNKWVTLRALRVLNMV